MSAGDPVTAAGGATDGSTIGFREVSALRAEEFVARGGHKRDFFPHRLYYLPKGGPDAFKLATRMLGGCAPEHLWEVVLYAHRDVVAEFPEDLFFDPDLIWHQQHFGRPGQVATANLVVRGDRLYSMVHISDLVQRISRRREHKTRVENRFQGWDQMLVNGILAWALERGLRTVLTPTADLAIRHTDPARSPARELFERVYDRHVQQRFEVRRDGEWWALDVLANRDRVVVPERGREPAPTVKVICVCHDIERGLGHVGVDRDLAERAELTAPTDLVAMLAVEAEAGVRATYSVVGTFLPEVRAMIEAGRHAVAFHSFDHPIEPSSRITRALARLRGLGRPAQGDQLARCRAVDYRIRGYRPPQSHLSAELSDENLCFHNFEWLASSAHSLGFRQPQMRGGLVKIPILFDDWPMYSRAVSYDAWEDNALKLIEQASFAAFSLHDCYARYWLPRYSRFLQAVRKLGVLQTLDEVANDVILRHAG